MKKSGVDAISIHSLRMEGDIVLDALATGLCIISIHSLRMEGDQLLLVSMLSHQHFNPLPPHGGRRLSSYLPSMTFSFQSTPSAWRETIWNGITGATQWLFQSTPSAWRETAKLHRKAFFISPILVQSCKKGCKRLHSAPEKMVFFEKREKNLVRNLQHLSVRL